LVLRKRCDTYHKMFIKKGRVSWLNTPVFQNMWMETQAGGVSAPLTVTGNASTVQDKVLETGGVQTGFFFELQAPSRDDFGKVSATENAENFSALDAQFNNFDIHKTWNNRPWIPFERSTS